jgi:GT2 family glycosyltransferase
MEIGIIITAKNCITYTQDCITSLLFAKVQTPYYLILIDDGSTDDTKAYFATLEGTFTDEAARGVIVVTDPPRDSLAGKWNMGLEIAKGKGCAAGLICNNDILFHPKTIDNVVARMEKALADPNDRVVLVSAQNRRGDVNPPNEIVNLEVPEVYSEADHPDFSCFLMSIEAWEATGRFWEGYKPCYFEDGDIHCTLIKNGMRGVCITSAPYYHYGSITQNSASGGVCKSVQFEQNRFFFRKRWGFVPGDKAYDEYTQKYAKMGE